MYRFLAIVLCAAICSLGVVDSAAAKPKTLKLSHAPDGSGGNNDAYDSYISGNGKFAVFRGPASNLVSGDANGTEDVFMCSTKGGAIRRISVSNTGVEGNGYSSPKAVSPTGRYVLMVSAASNLVEGDTNGNYDAFVIDTKENAVQLASLANDGRHASSPNYAHDMSPSGRFVLFASTDDALTSDDGNGLRDEFLRDLKLGTTELVSKTRPGLPTGECYSNGHSIGVPATARYIVFICEQPDADENDDINTQGESIYRLDRNTGETVLVSVSTAGVQATHQNNPAFISRNGRYVVFSSLDQLDPKDTNELEDVYVRDLKKNTTKLAVVGLHGELLNAGARLSDITPDARYLGIESASSNIDSAGNSSAVTHAYRYDRKKNRAVRLSRSSAGLAGNGSSGSPHLSDDGTKAVFHSAATNLVASDENAKYDVFLRKLPK